MPSDSTAAFAVLEGPARCGKQLCTAAWNLLQEPEPPARKAHGRWAADRDSHAVLGSIRSPKGRLLRNHLTELGGGRGSTCSEGLSSVPMFVGPSGSPILSAGNVRPVGLHVGHVGGGRSLLGPRRRSCPCTRGGTSHLQFSDLHPQFLWRRSKWTTWPKSELHGLGCSRGKRHFF